MKLISIVSPCYNEAENLSLLYRRVTDVMTGYPQYDYEIIWADNASTDNSRELMRRLAAEDKHLKLIFNAANFGQIRSPYNALLAAHGDAVVMMCADLQEPPEVIPDFIRAWEAGAKVVCGVKPKSKENVLMFALRRCYYKLIKACSETPQVENFTGFGLYDRCVIEALRCFHEPYPYMRGLVAEIGYRRVEVPYVQQRRAHGRTKNNFLSLYDYAMTGFVNHTKAPLRLAAFTGFLLAAVSLVTALAYFVYKLTFWNEFSVGIAPLVIGIFFFSSVQLIFIGIIGEYIGAIWTQVKNKPLVIEEERINFD
ncbi:MAG: glycosyltransferase family 2 protein [Kiritimatiellae bacterium]|nr:glycosyltransferase family 2 protein [Kiritimatiellia bacterium]